MTFASTRRDLLDGLRAARDYPLARSVIWVGIAWGFIGGGYEVLLAGHVTGDLGGSGVTLGLSRTDHQPDMSTYNAVARISLAALSAALTQYTLTVVGLARGAASVAVGVLWWIVFGRRSTYLYADRTEDLEAPLPDRKVDNDRH